MKNKFITALAGYLIEKEYFNLILPESEKLDFSNGTASLIKDFHGTTVLVEIIDGDMLDSRGLELSMEHGARVIKNMNGSNATLFKLFLFENQPDEQKLDIIKSSQIDLPADKRFLKALSIDISGGTISKHYSVPAFDAKIVRNVRRFFAKKLDRSGATAEDIEKLIELRKKDFDIQLKASKPFLTYALIAANILVWLVIRIISFYNGEEYGNLLEPFGAKINALILEGQFWRFLTPVFLHADEIHLALNSYSLFIIGTQVEKLYGRRRFMLIYVVSGILGNIASFAFSINASVGASGAIFGLFGAMLYFVIKRPSLLKSGFGANLITAVVVNLAYGILNKQIDNNAHMGGFIGGILVTGAVYPAGNETSRDKIVKAVSVIMAVIISAAGLAYGFNNSNNKIVPLLAEFQTLEVQGQWAGVEKLGEEIVNLEPADNNIKTFVLFGLAKAEINQHKYEEAIKHAETLAGVSPADGHFLQGFIYYYTDRYDKAREHLEKAKELESPNTETIDQMLSNIQGSGK
ncbi:rhomboid protease GluP [Ruminiclostridium hungatei]|uniref:Rhomboid protease GluP n=1 Tax=Ruminiclostridium hungatei TaxID=48256 RepID=A0A1V4SDW8_RUMHU|nr:rhomboid family intramembrane serine protease [Ruminiclostridium hungatei]OPX42014.1 rhomboid protease GluP [Ruminiclostridium hungatei]